MPKKKDEGLRDSWHAQAIIADLNERQRAKQKGTDMKVSDAFPSTFLAASDLQGKTAKVTIDSYRMHSFDDKEKDKLVLSFKGKKKEFVCNVTNAHIISANLGTDEIDDWIGKVIKIRSEKVRGPSGMVDGLRVVPEAPPESEDEEEGFE